MSLRTSIRAVTDALKADEWLSLPKIYERLPEPRPAKNNMPAELSTMNNLGMLERRGTPKHYEYRSGPTAAIDRRSLRRGVQPPTRRQLGFRALARLAESNPEAFAKEVENDTGFRR